MAAARDLRGSDEAVIALCGDAAFTCGITMEALNNVADTTKKLIIILNDNKWSISKNVGAISQYFNKLITNPIYNKLNDDFEAFLQKVRVAPLYETSVLNGKKRQKIFSSHPHCLKRTIFAILDPSMGMILQS